MVKSKRKQKAQLLANHDKIKREAFDFDKIEKYFLKSDKTKIFQAISDKTYQDLDMDELFMFVDRTTSKVGQQYLYHILRTLPENKRRNERFEELIRCFKENPKLKETILLQLSRLDNQEAYYITSLFQEDHVQKPAWFWVAPMLSILSIASVLLSFLFTQFILLLICILGINYIIHYWNKKNLYQYGGSIPQLLVLNQVVKEILKAKVWTKEAQAHNMSQSIKTIDNIGYRMSLFKLEAKLQSDVGMAVEYVFEVIKAFFLIEPLLLFNVLKELDTKRQQIHQLFQGVGEVDVAISIASLREGLPYYCHPVIYERRKQILGKDIYHPLLDKCVANNIELHQKSALLTGSNMSGKTTFIRTMGINTILAQTLNTCFAQEFVMPKIRVHSAIRIADDLMSDKSYYFEEVLTIKKMLEESRSGVQNLFLLDELFKGTNTVERIAAGQSVLTYLNKEDNIVFVATHDLELADYLQEAYNLYHFTEVVEGESIVFDYKIKAGNLKTTNAIRILELNHYPTEVINEARLVLEQIHQLKRVGRKL